MDTAVRLTAAKPLIFVYWGKHITSAEEARSKLPEGWLGDYLATFYPSEKPPGGGWLGMQRFEGDPIKFEYINRATPAYAPPPPRVRLLSQVKGLVASGKLLNEVVVKHLQSAGVDTGGNMEARVERLVVLGTSALQVAIDESATVRADKKAAKRTKAPAAAAPATVVATAVAGPAGLEAEADEEEEEGAREEEEEEEEEEAEATRRSSKRTLVLARDPAGGTLGLSLDSDHEVSLTHLTARVYRPTASDDTSSCTCILIPALGLPRPSPHHPHQVTAVRQGGRAASAGLLVRKRLATAPQLSTAVLARAVLARAVLALAVLATRCAGGAAAEAPAYHPLQPLRWATR